jgi:hypothetical protein
LFGLNHKPSFTRSRAQGCWLVAPPVIEGVLILAIGQAFKSCLFKQLHRRCRDVFKQKGLVATGTPDKTVQEIK